MECDDSMYKKIAIPIAQALGIGAASFASGDFGLRTSDHGLWDFLSEEKTKASKDIAESPTACRNAQKGLKTKDYGLKVWDKLKKCCHKKRDALDDVSDCFMWTTTVVRSLLTCSLYFAKLTALVSLMTVILI